MNAQKQSKLKVFPRKQTGEKNGRKESLGNEFKLSRNSNSVIKQQIKIVP